MRYLSYLAPLCLGLLLLVGCNGKTGFEKEARSKTLSKPKLKQFKLAGSRDRLTVLNFESKKKVQDDFFFTRPPYDLWGPFRVQVTAGLFDGRKRNVGDAIFGLELDARGPTPLQFYGVFAKYFTTPAVGMQVFVSSDKGNHGQTFFANATAVDLMIEHSGTRLLCFARPYGSVGNYTQIASLVVATPTAPLQAGIGTFGQDGGAIGFTNFQIPSNSAAPGKISAEHAALNRFYDACRSFLEAANAMNGPKPDPMTAEARLKAGLATLLLARADVEALPTDGATPKSIAIKNIDKLGKTAAKSLIKVQKKGAKAAKSVVKALTKKVFKPAALVTAAIIPQELRAALPFGGLPY